jgi:hypothetical protein
MGPEKGYRVCEGQDDFEDSCKSLCYTLLWIVTETFFCHEIDAKKYGV